MSAERCTICGVFGTSTYRCCGNNKEVRIDQIKKKIKEIDDTIMKLKVERLNLVLEKVDLENEK